MRHLFTKEAAMIWARERTQRNGTDHRVVEVKGMFAAGTMKQIDFHYPEALGWNLYHIY